MVDAAAVVSYELYFIILVGKYPNVAFETAVIETIMLLFICLSVMLNTVYCKFTYTTMNKLNIKWFDMLWWSTIRVSHVANCMTVGSSMLIHVFSATIYKEIHNTRV